MPESWQVTYSDPPKPMSAEEEFWVVSFKALLFEAPSEGKDFLNGSPGKNVRNRVFLPDLNSKMSQIRGSHRLIRQDNPQDLYHPGEPGRVNGLHHWERGWHRIVFCSGDDFVFVGVWALRQAGFASVDTTGRKPLRGRVKRGGAEIAEFCCVPPPRPLVPSAFQILR